MSEEKEIITMDYGDKQYFIALRGIVERKEKNWKNGKNVKKNCAKVLKPRKKPPKKETR